MKAKKNEQKPETKGTEKKVEIKKPEPKSVGNQAQVKKLEPKNITNQFPLKKSESKSVGNQFPLKKPESKNIGNQFPLKKSESKNITNQFPLKKPESKSRKKKYPFQIKVVQMRRVSKTVKGGKKLTFSTVVIVGNKKGKIGFGIGRANDVNIAIDKATYNGKKYLLQIPLTKNRSILHEVQAKFGASKVFIKPAETGTGVIAGGPVRTVLELVGIKNVLAKQFGSSNIINNSRATILALLNLKNSRRICVDRSISSKTLLKRVSV
jgi:small subunit ribosomal protein S5